MGKSTGSIAVALIVGAAVGFVLGKVSSDPGETKPSAAVAAAPTPTPAQQPGPAPKPGEAVYYNVTFTANQPTKGPADAKVTIIEVSDFQCPFCSRVNPTVAQILEKWPNDVRVVWGNNPLSFHKDAMPAAEAAYAAHEQGKFWEMHDKIFANQRELTRPNFESWAKELGLDMTKFKAALDSNKFKQQIEAEQKLYNSRGARGTPAFFINGHFLSGAQPFSAFESAIEAELKRADAELAKGTSKKDLYAKLIANGRTTPAPPPGQPAAPTGPVYVEVPADIPVKGPADAKVTIVQFTDFQCPFCSRVNPTLAQIEKTYGKDVRIALRHLPLPFHNNAHLAAEAGFAAHEQGKFWQLHDKMFANQSALAKDDLVRYAKEIGLDTGKFQQALDSGKYKARVDEELKYANSVGARGTPAFFVNGKLVSGAQPFENFKKVIDEELARADALLKQGTPREQLYAKLTGKK